MEFRRAAADSAATFVALDGEVAAPRLYAPTLDPARAAAEIAGNDLFLVRLGGEVVGTAACRVDGGGSFYLSSNNAVRSGHQGRGIGRAAVAFLLARYPAARRAWLVTHPEYAAALRLYGHFGFVVGGRREDCFGDGEPRLGLSRRQDNTAAPAVPPS